MSSFEATLSTTDSAFVCLPLYFHCDLIFGLLELSITTHYRATMSKPTLELIETDEAGNVVATYVQTSTGGRNATRIDRIVTHHSESIQSSHSYLTQVPKGSQKSLKTLLDVFLPSGYPQSVTEDYLPYVASFTRVRATALTLSITDIKSLCVLKYHTTVKRSSALTKWNDRTRYRPFRAR